MSKPLDLSRPGWLARLILHEWLRDRHVARQRQDSGSLNAAATAAYRDAHDAQTLRKVVALPPGGRAAGRLRLVEPWAPNTWIDP